MTPQVITVSGDTLFHVASVYLGDATQWFRIAALNGITDPWLSGLVVLKIPSRQTLSGG